MFHLAGGGGGRAGQGGGLPIIAYPGKTLPERGTFSGLT